MDQGSDKQVLSSLKSIRELQSLVYCGITPNTSIPLR
jgi:hypothetical protein